jgi:tetratricopeptide (TPR) repeat protein
MSYSLIPFVLILLSLATMIIIVVRKFPQLALLDVDNIPAVKEEKKKEEFLKKRVEEKATNLKRFGLKKVFLPFGIFFKQIQKAFRLYVGRVERLVAKESVAQDNPAVKIKDGEEIKNLLRDGDYFLTNGDFNSAENKYIAAVRIDPKSFLAYKGLGEVYTRLGQLDQAVETYKFLLQLNAADDNIYVKLGDLMEQKGDLNEAINNYEKAILLNDQNASRFIRIADLLKALRQNQTALEAVKQAVEIEPNNPKYLDNLIELAILVDNKKLAEDTYRELRMVNPENQKLAVLKEKIDKIRLH